MLAWALLVLVASRGVRPEPGRKLLDAIALRAGAKFEPWKRVDCTTLDGDAFGSLTMYQLQNQQCCDVMRALTIHLIATHFNHTEAPGPSWCRSATS